MYFLDNLLCHAFVGLQWIVLGPFLILNLLGIITLELFMTQEQISSARHSEGYPRWPVTLPVGLISPIIIGGYFLVMISAQLGFAAVQTLKGRGFKPAYKSTCKPKRERRTTAKTRATREKLRQARTQ